MTAILTGTIQEAFIGGWYLTGDIGMIDGEKKLHIIDRKKLFLELYVKGRSVWIPTGKVESLFQRSAWIDQLYVHGDRAQDSLIAVAVPRHSQVCFARKLTLCLISLAQVQDWAAAHGVQLGPVPEEWALNTELVKNVGKEILLDFQAVGKEHSLEEYEIPKGIVVDFAPWTTENCMLTGFGKVARKTALARYHLAIELEYARLQEGSSHH